MSAATAPLPALIRKRDWRPELKRAFEFNDTGASSGPQWEHALADRFGQFNGASRAPDRDHVFSLTQECAARISCDYGRGKSGSIVHAFSHPDVSYVLFIGTHDPAHPTIDAKYWWVDEPQSSATLGETIDALREQELTQRAVSERLAQAFAASVDIEFEDGYDNDLSRTIRELVAEHGSMAVDALRQSYEAGQIRPTIAAEIMKTLGELDDKATEDARRALLASALSDKNMAIRLGATIGIANLPLAPVREQLARARADEPNKLIRKLLDRALAGE